MGGFLKRFVFALPVSYLFMEIFLYFSQLFFRKLWFQFTSSLSSCIIEFLCSDFEKNRLIDWVSTKNLLDLCLLDVLCVIQGELKDGCFPRQGGRRFDELQEERQLHHRWTPPLWGCNGMKHHGKHQLLRLLWNIKQVWINKCPQKFIFICIFIFFSYCLTFENMILNDDYILFRSPAIMTGRKKMEDESFSSLPFNHYLHAEMNWSISNKFLPISAWKIGQQSIGGLFFFLRHLIEKIAFLSFSHLMGRQYFYFIQN